jgi:hypothetical protein
LALSAGGVLGGAGGALDLAVATPQHLGLSGGEYFPMARNAECPGDQAADDALAVRFDTPPLAAPLSLTGAARLHLALTSDRPLAFVVARLCDVAPDGRSLRIAHGMLNLCHRDSLAAPAPLTPGEPVAVVLALDHMAHRLAPGHRLRLALSTTCWPFLWPSPEAATLRLHAGHLDLPVQTAAAPGWEPPPPVAAAPWRHRVLAPPAAARRVEHDLIGGGVTLVVEEDAGVTEDLDHGLVAGSAMAERWQIHPGDPLSAQVAIRWTQTLSRGDWSVRTEATTALQATATDLVFRHWLTAWDGETRVFDRDDEQRVPRRFV